MEGGFADDGVEEVLAAIGVIGVVDIVAIFLGEVVAPVLIEFREDFVVFFVKSEFFVGIGGFRGFGIGFRFFFEANIGGREFFEEWIGLEFFEDGIAEFECGDLKDF